MNAEQAWDHFVQQVMNVAGGIEQPERAVAAGKLYAAAAVAEALAQEWAVLDGPEIDYTKLSAEQENLYCYAFNTGSKAAGEQMVAEARAPLVEALRAALRRRCDNRKCSFCEYLHDEQPEEYELRAAAALAAKETP